MAVRVHPGRKPLTPILECVETGPGGGFLAHFGYDNPNAEPVVEPFENSFAPAPEDRGQPIAFAPGRVKDASQVESEGGPLTWALTGNQVTASKDSRLCAGSLTVVKVLNPSDDAGRFNLEIGGVIAGGAAAVGDGAPPERSRSAPGRTRLVSRPHPARRSRATTPRSSASATAPLWPRATAHS